MEPDVRIEQCGPKHSRFWFDCPKTPGKECHVLLKPWPINAPTWEWDGNAQEPTLSPSIDCTDCGWHGHIVKGKTIQCLS